MASLSPATFPSSARSSDPTPHKLTYATPKFTTTTASRLNHRSTYSSTLFSHRISTVSDCSTICRCQKNNDKRNNNNNDNDNDNDNHNENPSRWDAVFQMNVRNVIQWFDDYMSRFRENLLEKGEQKKNDYGSGFVNREGEVTVDDYGDWDWERWKKHFTDVDEQERIVSILQSQLTRAVIKEDYEDAARIKVAIAAAATNDTVGRVMSQLNKAIKEERYKDAAFVRDYASAGLVGWWAGFSDDSEDPYGRIIRISAEHGRYLARSYSARQLAKAADGVPLFEVFITINKKGEYKHQAVYLKQNESPKDFTFASSKSSNLVNLNPRDSISDKNDLFTNDNEDNFEDSDDGFENILRDMIPGGKDVKIKVMNMTSSGKIDRDLITKLVKQIMEEEEEEDDDDDNEEEEENNDTDSESIDINFDFDFDSDSTIINGENNSQIAVKVVVGGLVQNISNEKSFEDLIRVPAKLDKKSQSSFTFSIEKEKDISSANSQSLTQKDDKIEDNRSIDSVMLDLVKSIGKEKIPTKVLKDVNQLINLTLSQGQNRQPLSGSTTFNRIELPSTKDPLNGLYVGAHGIYASEVIHLKRKFGQWKEDGGTKEFSDLEFYEYVEAVKITGDPYVPAGQVAFRAKVGTKYQLPHKGIIPQEFGVIARYQGQGRLADPGFQNPRWVDGELVILDGKHINGGPVVGFVYWDPEYNFLMFFNQLRLQE